MWVLRAAEGLVLRDVIGAPDVLDRGMLDGTWKPDDAWWGMKEGTVVISPFSSAMPDNVRAAADKVIAGWKDGSYDVFTARSRISWELFSHNRSYAGGRRPDLVG